MRGCVVQVTPDLSLIIEFLKFTSIATPSYGLHVCLIVHLILIINNLFVTIVQEVINVHINFRA